MSNHSHYRADIDGLRAFAIMPVVLFHSGFSWIPGGFVGVDIFFVISGYLITQIILREIQSNTFSIVDFYERRAKRIMPVFIVVISITAFLSWFIFLPDHLDDTLKSAVASTFFSSNIWFLFSSQDYFGPSVELAPLLHTWSLSVEEQFYIFFPLLILFLQKKFPRSINFFILLVIAISFFLSAVAVTIKPSATFYLLPTRAWELGVGAILAIYSKQFPINKNYFGCLLNITGFFLIFIAFFTFDKSVTFPGASALVPCLGAALLILTGNTYKISPLSVILTTKISVFIGKISYSLYMWHWPVIVFTKYLTSNTNLSFSLSIFVIIFSFLLSIFSWKYIEAPFRKNSVTRTQIFVFTIVSAISIMISAALILTNEKLKYKLTHDQQLIVDSTYDRVPERKNCWQIDSFGGLCPIGIENKDNNYDFLFWGDSHAEAISEVINIAAANRGQSGLVTSVNCPPLLGVMRKLEPRCTAYTESIMNELVSRNDIQVVILHARWAWYETGSNMQGEAGNQISQLNTIFDLNAEKLSSTHDVFYASINRTINNILASGRKVIIIDSIPEVGWNVPDALLKKTRWGIPTPKAPTVDSTAERQAGVRRIFSNLENVKNVKIISPISYLCPNEECLVEYNSLPVYYDDDHLTNSAAIVMLKNMVELEVFDTNL